MKQIAHELTEIVRNDAKTDQNLKKSVRAELRTRIKRLLRPGTSKSQRSPLGMGVPSKSLFERNHSCMS